MIRTIFAEGGEWWMMCGADKVRVLLTDDNDEPIPVPEETTQDDKRTTDLRQI